MTFSELGLKEELLQGLTDLGFETPTPIQQQAIPVLLEGDRDLVALAQTGTGKTAGFGLPMLNLTEAGHMKVQSVVLSPTRELGNQIAEDLKKYSKHMKGIKVVCVYGGANISTQIRELKRGCNIIVATPGRLIDLIKRGAAKLEDVNRVILDEADEMLNMGFKDDLDFILGQTPNEKTTWLFSATMAKEVERISRNYMDNPFKITVGSQNEGAKNIVHKYFKVQHRNRYSALKRIVDCHPQIFGLIFCRTKRDTQEISDRLMAEGYSVDALHGDLSQQQRDRVMDKFRNKKIQLLCATDVAARGIDVSDITHVINYELPEDSESYTHRSGRTARAGKQGESLAIITDKDIYKIRRIEKIIKKKFIHDQVPSGDVVMEAQLFKLIAHVKETKVIEEEFSKYRERVMAEFEEFSKEEIIEHFMSRDFNKFIEYYKDSNDVNHSGGRERGERNDRGDRRDRGRGDRGDRRDRGDRGERRDRGPRGDRGDRGERRDRTDRGERRDAGAQEGFNTIFLNVGSSDGMDKGKLIDFVCNESSIRGRVIGKIRMNDKFSFLEVENDSADNIKNALDGSDYEGRSLRAEFAKPRR